MCFAMMLFVFARPKTLTPDCIGTALSFLSNAIRVKNQLAEKETPKKSKTTKEATKESKHDVTDGHENEAQSPCKNLQGRPICSPKNLDFSRLRNQIRMRSLVPRERNKQELAIDSRKFLDRNDSTTKPLQIIRTTGLITIRVRKTKG